jgi:hypothetical protein
MKILQILCLVITLAFTLQITLKEGMIMGIESGVLQNLYLTIFESNCAGVQEGVCGSVFGSIIPTSNTSLLNIVLRSKKNIQWNVLKSDNFYCFKSEQANAFLSLYAQDCSNLNENKQCGTIILNKLKDMKCSQNNGWKIAVVRNNYILESAQFPNVYLYLDGRKCQQPQNFNMRVTNANNISNLRNCGIAAGFYLKNNSDLYNNNNNADQWVLFNLREIQAVVRR